MTIRPDSAHVEQDGRTEALAELMERLWFTGVNDAPDLWGTFASRLREEGVTLAAPAEGLRDVTPTPKPGDTWEPPQALPRPAAPAEGLEEERLARALRYVDVLEGYPWDDQVPEGWRHRALAAAIAREYAALEASHE